MISRAKVGSRVVVRTYPFTKVHAVTYRGNRFVLTPKSDQPELDESGRPVRSPRQIDEVIATVGASDPQWLDSTELQHPDTLDLSWPLKAEGKWNNKKNMGQFIWDIINPNPPRWRSGIKTVYLCMERHRDDSVLLRRDMNTLGRMYFDLMQDYPRAAYWLRKAGAERGERPGVMLAECYYRLGNREMAMQHLSSRTYQAGAAVGAIKLYGNMGELNQAMKMMQRVVNTRASYEGLIAAGDAMQQAGDYDKAIELYRGVLADKNFRNADYEKRYKARATESIRAIELFEKAEVSRVPDGTFNSQSTGYNGRMRIAVTVADGRITAVKVTEHREKQFYSALTDTEASIVDLQSVKGVDGTSGATITSRAIVNAAAQALADAAK